MGRRIRQLIGALALAAASIAPAGAAVLSGGYAGGNANDGILFDLDARSAVTLEAFDINADFGTFDYSVYYRMGGVAGALEEASGWIELGRFDALTTAGIGNATRLDIADLALSAGLYGFYITDSGAFSVQYSDSDAASGSVQASNGPLDLLVGYGSAAGFGGAVANRAFNGAITFSTASAVPEPASWAMLLPGFGLLGLALRRRRRLVPRAA